MKMTINYSKLVPEGTFLHQYMSHMQDQETAYAYDFWCGLWCMSNAIGRHITVGRPRAPVFLNLYAILVAESGTTRKSSAIRCASDLVQKLNIEMIHTKTTADALEDKLDMLTNQHGESQIAIAISELISFLGKGSGAVAMPGLLTDLYDCPSLRKSTGTLTKGSVKIANVFVSFLAASTPSWLLQSVNPNVIEGGFTSRCLFIVSNRRKKKIAWPSTETNDDIHLYEHLVRMRKDSAKVEQIMMTDKAIERFKSWYNRRTEFHDAYRSTFAAREDAHILRLAGFLCINDDRWHIDLSDINKAIKVIRSVREDGAKIFELGGEQSQTMVAADRIRSRVIGVGGAGIDKQSLIRSIRNAVTSDVAQSIITAMHEAQLVTIAEKVNKSTGKRRQFVYANKSMRNATALDDVAKIITDWD